MATAARTTTGRKKSPTRSAFQSVESSHGATEPITTAPRLATSLHPVRMKHISENERKWVNGTTLHYYFFNRNSDGPDGGWTGSSAQKALVRKAFQSWKEAGTGLNFCEVSHREDAELRIGFQKSDGNWSCIGRDAIDIAGDSGERTMNVCGDLTAPGGWREALRLTGHAMGFREPEMHLPRKLAPKAGLPDGPIALVHRFYPPLTTVPDAELLPGRSRLLALAPGEQASFRVRPLVTRPYTIRLFGECDAVMVLFEELNGLALYDEFDGETEFLTGSDDSGTARNATIKARLHRDREYVLRIRVYYRNSSQETAVLLW